MSEEQKAGDLPQRWSAARKTEIVLRLLLVVLISACGEENGERARSPAGSLVAVRDFRLGSAVDESGAVVAAADSFARRDTVYASVSAEGHVGQATLTARWTREDNILMGERQKVFPLDGRRTVTFRLDDPGGLPAGAYRVEMRLGSELAGSKSFRIVDAAPMDREED